MKKLIVLLALSALIFTCGCNTNPRTAEEDKKAEEVKNSQQNNPFGSVDENDKAQFYPECISSATAVYAESNRVHNGSVNISLNVAHCGDFAYYRGLDKENSEFNNIALTRSVYGVILNPASHMGNADECITLNEVIYTIDDYLSDGYDFDTVKGSADWLTVDSFGSDLQDGIYLVLYNIGVLTENGEVDYSKLVWGTDSPGFYLEKKSGYFKVYTGYEWYKKRSEDLYGKK